MRFGQHNMAYRYSPIS